MDFRACFEDYKKKVDSARSPVEFGESRIDVHMRDGRVIDDVVVVEVSDGECIVVMEFTTRDRHILALSDVSTINPKRFYHSFVGWS